MKAVREAEGPVLCVRDMSLVGEGGSRTGRMMRRV